MFLQMLGWAILVIIGFWSGGTGALLLMFDGFMGASSGGVQWIFIVISIIFFILSYIFSPFAIVLS